MKQTQHPTNNFILKAPPGVPKSEVEDLVVTLAQYPNGQKIVVSYWRPSAEEIQKINQGKLVAISMFGEYLPPICVDVDGAPNLPT